MFKVLKIGGSAITDKAKADYVRAEEIERIAGEISDQASGLVLVHGAGSFGHIPAKKYGLPGKFDPEGLRVTHASVAKLNQIVVEALAEAGVEALPVHPLSCVLLKDGRIEKMEVDFIKEMITRGILPVLHGDVAMDSSRGAGIVSGDQLVPYLAKDLGAQTVALGTDVDGVLCSGAPLKEVTRKTLPEIESCFMQGPGADVTGGMRGKILELLELADAGTISLIFNARKAGMVKRALSGEAVGTIIRRSN
jgi:isopentenyl phosphate kinase